MKHVYIDHQHYATHNGIKYTLFYILSIAIRTSLLLVNHDTKTFRYQNTKHFAMPITHRTGPSLPHTRNIGAVDDFDIGNKTVSSWAPAASCCEVGCGLSHSIYSKIGEGLLQSVLLKLTKTLVCWSIMGILKLTKTLVCVSHVYGHGSRIREPVTKWAAFIPGAFDDPGFINPWDVPLECTFFC